MLAGGILETVHLLRGQIFPLPQIGVARPPRRNCPIYEGWGPRMALGFCTIKVGLRENAVRIRRVWAAITECDDTARDFTSAEAKSRFIACWACAPAGRPPCRPPSSGGSTCVFAWALA